jgi:hypothetical protein
MSPPEETSYSEPSSPVNQEDLLQIQVTASGRVQGYIRQGAQNPRLLEVHPHATVQNLIDEIQYETEVQFPLLLLGWQYGQYGVMSTNSTIGHHVSYTGSRSFIYDSLY